MKLKSRVPSSCSTVARILIHLSHVASDVLCAPLIQFSAVRYASRLGLPCHFLVQLFSFEDKRFALHPGVDPVAVIRAAITRGAAFRTIQGGSTITQQLYSCLQRPGSPRHSRTVHWKIKQSVWAPLTEIRMTKLQILSEYLDHVYWGRSYFGLDSAALGYFDSTREHLSVPQSFFLAERLARPNSLSIPRVLHLFQRPMIFPLFKQDRVAVRQLIAIYDKRFGRGGELWECLEKFLRKSAVPTSKYLLDASNVQ